MELGTKRNRLTLIEYLPKINQFNSALFRCECSKEIKCVIERVEEGIIKDCGCKIRMQIGEKKGKITLLELLGRDDKYMMIGKFRCDCGIEKNIPIKNVLLPNGKGTKSCGCLIGAHSKNIDRSKNIKSEPMKIGDKKNMLTLLEEVGISNRGYKTGRFKCDCGEEVITTLASVNKKIRKSCGCLIGKPYPEASLNNIYNTYKSGAIKRRMTFNLTIEQFKNIIKLNCWYCGAEPVQVKDKRERKKKYPLFYNGIDRVDNTIGYEIDNCLPCCCMCNWSKRDYTQEQYINKCNEVSKKHRR